MREAKHYIIKEETEPLYPSGKKYMLYYEDGTPRYMGAETREALIEKLHEVEPDATVV